MTSSLAATLETEVAALARRIAELGTDERTRVFRMSWWSERMLDWAMSHPSFKTQLFRFVDVFPATTSDADVLRHLEEYFADASASGDMPRALDLGLGVAEHAPFGMGAAVSASVARKNIRRMAEQFNVGATPSAAVDGLHRLWRLGSAATVDLLGEKTVTESEADVYAGRVSALLDALLAAVPTWAPDDHLERDDIGSLPRANVSIKPTALASLYAPLTRVEGLAQARSRLVPLLTRAARDGAFVWFDMEHYDVKDLTLELFRSLLDEPSLAGLHAGVVMQAYLKDSYDDLRDLVAWASGRAGSPPVSVRLVKGAYWDAETITSRAEGWPVPVFEHKVETDANYERCARLLHDHHGVVRAAFGSHNLRSLAYAVTYARSLGIPDTGYELQMLYGMAEPVHAAVRRLGFRLRVYAPVGELVPGMAYLVRRLLENTSNESFVRQRFAEGLDVDALVAAPMISAESLPSLPPPARRAPTDVASVSASGSPYSPEPVGEWRRASVRAAFGAAVDDAPSSFPVDVPAVIEGSRVATAATIESVDPACPATTCVAVSASCGAAEASDAVAAGLRVFDAWRRTPVSERAAVLFRAAEWMRARRHSIAALEVFEAGKPWKEADADVCEAIDFCEYYGREMLRLAAGGVVQSPPGEANVLAYQPKGVGAVIAPWNFPLAIPTGMVAAALVAGNCVVFKPAEQTPAIASCLLSALEAGGLPPGVLGFVPGLGSSVGAALVSHPDVSFVAFTGSREVGLSIVSTAARVVDGQRSVKRVIAEMGGKNAIVVDADADLDTAVPAIVQSAFGFAGQKCSAASRVVAVDAVYDELRARLAGAVRSVVIGHPRSMSTQVGPVIDADALAKVRSYVDAGEGGVVVSRADDVPASVVSGGGYFVGPCVFEDVPLDGRLATEEIFGPVLCLFRAGSFADAVELANSTPYALTAGVLSRSPANIRFAAAELRAGNVYVNRSTTGAVVGRQPFGGYGMSGVGSKAGGPDYLLQFLDPRVVTENTMRQGFAPT
jgi:RHH-type proline utilization regulon transcriptional repressor/proline dehydrogenase/delta 1-pyrroline-5-carboxylate dehydrogenase